MDVSKISIGKDAPREVNVIIEIPMNSDPVKYEFDKDAGAIIVDRFMKVPMFYPCNYGFIPHTLSDDGDPADVLVVSNYPIISGAVIACRPVAVLMMEDESGKDEKIIAVPTTKLDPEYKDVKDINDLSSQLVASIQHFFEYYKKLDANKWVKVTGFEGREKAEQLIQEAIDRA